MKPLLMTIISLALPLSAQAAVSQMWCVLTEKNANNPHLSRTTKAIDELSETGFSVSMMGQRFHAQVKVDLDGAAQVKIYEHVRVVVNQHTPIAMVEETSFGAQTEPNANGQSAAVRCRLY